MTSRSPAWRAVLTSTWPGLPPSTSGQVRAPGGECTEYGVERGPQALPGIVFPQLTQVKGRVRALVQVTAGRRPSWGDQDGIAVAGETSRVAQRMHAAW